jgi:hypothetical protein
MTDKQETNHAFARSRSNAGLALHDLCEAMFVAYNKHVKEHYYEPKMRVTFSPYGYDKVRACAEAMMRFSNPCADAQTVNGYPFSVERDQKDDFIVHVANVELTGSALLRSPG